MTSQAPGASEPPTSSWWPPRRSSRAPRVLIVDDDPEMRELLAMTLRRDGYEVVEAESGERAAEFIEETSLSRWSTKVVDLIITDVRMPGLGGIRLAEMVRSARWAIPVLLMTGFPDTEVEENAKRLDMELLAKPFRLELLRRIVLCTLVERVKGHLEGEKEGR